MKVVILAGGLGTRISEESHLKPKPMIEISGRPILWHIMKYYSHFGYNEFIICCGYKGYVIKEYFNDYFLHTSDITFDFRNGNGNQMVVHKNTSEQWRVTLVDTGYDTQTGGRLARIKEYVKGEPFLMTYGDGVSDVDIKATVEYHKKHGKIATITAVQPSGRFGVLELDEQNDVLRFAEKSKEDGGWINSGFMVFNPEIFKHLQGDDCILERNPMEQLSRDKQLVAYKHNGFWQCMDTLREKERLEWLLKNNRAPWKVWED